MLKVFNFYPRCRPALLDLMVYTYKMEDSLLIAMVLKRLPVGNRLSAIHLAHTNDQTTFAKYKNKLQIFEEIEKIS